MPRSTFPNCRESTYRTRFAVQTNGASSVRKTQYFWQNTQFHGHRFNYHGSPLAILRGRIIAVVLLLAYSWSFDISTTAAVIAVSVLCLVAPWLFLRAQEFKLRNTSYRGLRFGFDARAPRTYPLLFVLALLWFSATLAGLLLAQTSWVVALSLAPLLLFPWMHHSVKRLQPQQLRHAADVIHQLPGGVLFHLRADGRGLRLRHCRQHHGRGAAGPSR